MTMKITLDRKTLEIIGVEHIDDEEATPKQIATAIAPAIKNFLENNCSIIQEEVCEQEI